MITLCRAASKQEKNDYDDRQAFRTGINTLEAKQFFKSRIAITQFVARSVQQEYQPPYEYLFILNVDENCLDIISHKNMNLDGFDAVNIDEDHLPDFNNCVRFVKQESL